MNAMFIGWGAVVRGREKQALQVFQESIEYYGRLQQEGRIERFDVVLLGPHGGDLYGFVVLHGDRQALNEIRLSDEFERLSSAPRQSSTSSALSRPTPVRRSGRR